jgi:putative phosphoribosyl transferase
MGRARLRGLREMKVAIPVEGDRIIHGSLSLPPRPQGLVIFAHGSGSSRFSVRNQFVAGVLQEAQLATLVVDLLTRREEAIDELTGHLRFDIDRLAARVVAATDWATQHAATAALPEGYFGASTGAAAALVAAAQRPSIRAVVSRGGRPDLARDVLDQVSAPTLLVVGDQDFGVVELNEEAHGRLGCTHKSLRLVRGATHLFSEPGALDEVARLASDWFERHLIC